MNREEILAKARNENDGIDYYELEVSSRGGSIAWAVALCILAVMLIADIIMGLLHLDSFIHLHEATIVIVTALACKYFYKYSRIKNSRDLKIGILCCVVLFLDIINIILGLLNTWIA